MSFAYPSAAQYAKPGVIGRVKLDGINEPLEVVIENASASADPLARTYFVRAGFKALVSREAASVRPSMFSRIEITAGKASRRFVPESALTREADWRGRICFANLSPMGTGLNQSPIFIGCVSALVKTVLQKCAVWKTVIPD